MKTNQGDRGGNLKGKTKKNKKTKKQRKTAWVAKKCQEFDSQRAPEWKRNQEAEGNWKKGQ